MCLTHTSIQVASTGEYGAHSYTYTGVKERVGAWSLVGLLWAWFFVCGLRTEI